MRKLVVALFAVGSLCLMALPAFAEKGDMAFGLNGGMAIPLGQLADEDNGNMKMGFDGGLFFDYMVTKVIAVGLDGSYVTMTNQDNSDGKTKTMQYGAHAKYFFPMGGQFLPYLSLGLAGYNRKAEFSAAAAEYFGTDNVSDNVLGMNLGVGVDYKVTPMVDIGANGASHRTFGEFKPEELGGGGLDDWHYLTFNAVVTFHFPKAK
jgi:opacity protein-like surface antigen